MGRAILLTFALALLPSISTAGDVQLRIREGLVSISATNASVGQILAAWARVGQTTILNAEKVPSPLLTLEVTDMPEREALDLVLRSASGYVAIPRVSAAPDLSTFERVLIMATSTAVATPPGRATAPPPVYISPEHEGGEPSVPSPGVERLIGPDGQPVPDDQEGAPPARRAPLGYSSGDPPPGVDPRSSPASDRRTVPGSVPVPGMIVQPVSPEATPQG
jgi:hypothetical protein